MVVLDQWDDGRGPARGPDTYSRCAKTLVALAIVATVVVAAAGAAGGDRTATRVTVPGRLSVRGPVGWHLLRGRLSDVIAAVPRLAVRVRPLWGRYRSG